MRDPRCLGPSELEAELRTLIGEDLPAELSERREAVEALGRRADPWLLALRELEAITDGLPSDLGGVRRGRFWAQDPVSVTFEGWDGHGRVALRVLRPSVKDDPVWRRRLERAARTQPGPEILAPERYVDEVWPHLVVPLPGTSLADLLPVEDPPDPRIVARYVGGGLAGLRRLHAGGLVHGGLTPAHLVQTCDGVKLAWLDPVLPRPRDACEDLADLGRAIAELDPENIDPVASLARGLAEGPTPTAEMAEELLVRTLGSVLADRRHRLAMRRRIVARRGDEARLLSLARRLQTATQPPSGKFCLRAGHDSVLVVAESDGSTVKGGPVANIDARFMPTVWSADRGLDAVAARALMRGWATRTRGDEERRSALMVELTGTDARADVLCRWLSCQARLRAVRMLLELGGR
ncbi:MAG TPA: hypothetical protein QGF58_01955 [Myxococcota bacterium]|nr:hypothetical protein [Myxococcota bacterium]